MTQLTLVPNNGPRCNVVDLFNNETPKQAAALRASEQRDRLAGLAARLADMLDQLDVELKVDRERAVSLLAEYTGLLEMTVEEISCIRDIDEKFGGHGRRVPRVARLAENLEKGLAYLLGIFSVASTGENLSPFNWQLIERDVQAVLGTSRAIGDELAPAALKEAA